MVDSDYVNEIPEPEKKICPACAENKRRVVMYEDQINRWFTCDWCKLRIYYEELEVK